MPLVTRINQDLILDAERNETDLEMHSSLDRCNFSH